MRKCAINLHDGRLVYCTKETLANINYYPVSDSVCALIQSGKVSSGEVIKKIKNGFLADNGSWDEFVAGKTTQNVRSSNITNQVEKAETVIDSVDKEFTVKDLGEQGSADKHLRDIRNRSDKE